MKKKYPSTTHPVKLISPITIFFSSNINNNNNENCKKHLSDLYDFVFYIQFNNLY